MQVSTFNPLRIFSELKEDRWLSYDDKSKGYPILVYGDWTVKGRRRTGLWLKELDSMN